MVDLAEVLLLAAKIDATVFHVNKFVIKRRMAAMPAQIWLVHIKYRLWAVVVDYLSNFFLLLPRWTSSILLQVPTRVGIHRVAGFILRLRCRHLARSSTTSSGCLRACAEIGLVQLWCQEFDNFILRFRRFCYISKALHQLYHCLLRILLVKAPRRGLQSYGLGLILQLL